jgi:hypothetical protein
MYYSSSEVRQSLKKPVQITIIVTRCRVIAKGENFLQKPNNLGVGGISSELNLLQI